MDYTHIIPMSVLVLILYDIYVRFDYLGKLFKGQMVSLCTVFATSYKSLFQNKKLKRKPGHN